MPLSHLILPQVRTIGLAEPLHWLVLGWRDVRQAGWISVLHGLVLALVGAAIMLVAHHRFWLLAGALSGFLVVAPVLATSLYAISRALEQGLPVNRELVLRTWLNWQNSHISKWGNDYWCLFQFGALLALAATGWVVTSAALITLLAPVPINEPIDFLRHVVLADGGWLFELWLAIGSLLVAPIFASSVVAMPLLLDRRASIRMAVLTSWQTVLANPLPMAFWAVLIAGLTVLGLATLLFLGLVLLIPVLGHASWHAYRALVDASSLPLREPLVSTAWEQGGRP